MRTLCRSSAFPQKGIQEAAQRESGSVSIVGVEVKTENFQIELERELQLNFQR